MKKIDQPITGWKVKKDEPEEVKKPDVVKRHDLVILIGGCK
jgi:hypothetical protein